jgi:hypothetical protein
MVIGDPCGQMECENLRIGRTGWIVLWGLEENVDAERLEIVDCCSMMSEDSSVMSRGVMMLMWH